MNSRIRNGITVQTISTVVFSWNCARLVPDRFAVLEDRVEHHAEHGDEDDDADPEDERVEVVHLLRDRRDRRLQVPFPRRERRAGRQRSASAKPPARAAGRRPWIRCEPCFPRSRTCVRLVPAACRRRTPCAAAPAHAARDTSRGARMRCASEAIRRPASRAGGRELAAASTRDRHALRSRARWRHAGLLQKARILARIERAAKRMRRASCASADAAQAAPAARRRIGGARSRQREVGDERRRQRARRASRRWRRRRASPDRCGWRPSRRARGRARGSRAPTAARD